MSSVGEDGDGQAILSFAHQVHEEHGGGVEELEKRAQDQHVARRLGCVYEEAL